MIVHFTRSYWLLASLTASLLVSACGGGGSQASTSDLSINGSRPGVTPFISFVELRGESLSHVTSLRYTIKPKTDAASNAVDVTYAIGALLKRGYYLAGGDMATLPVFGLYAGYVNRVALELSFDDASKQVIDIDIATADYRDPNGVYQSPNVVKKRIPGSTLGFDFFAIKSGLGSPIVIDTDSEIRWLAQGIANSISSATVDNAFLIGDQGSTSFYRLDFDGTIVGGALAGTAYTGFHHNIDPGKRGLLAEMNAVSNGVANVDSVLAEFDPSGLVLMEWDLSSLLATHMRSRGDDPAPFIRPGVDWFHMNAATYDPRDNSIIVSSRENFVIKLDYVTGDVIWILGDPTKYWHTFPSLQDKALTLESGGLFPIGQHATSITSDGLLMLFNDGFPSVNQPAGAPAGESRDYSAVSAYAIDQPTRTAREVWRFDYDQTIDSPVCSSAYEAGGKSVLVSYAVASQRSRARLVGLDADHNVIFDFEYPTMSCNTSWNAVPIDFGGMEFR